jgi:hypothetical protein
MKAAQTATLSYWNHRLNSALAEAKSAQAAIEQLIQQENQAIGVMKCNGSQWTLRESTKLNGATANGTMTNT